ncbi:MAG: Gfo/Idh/MocA family oxidoreductase [Dermatophilaceae bacterium]
MTNVRWGIAGPGRMAAAMVAAFPEVTNGELAAVGSRSLERAQTFADEHGIPRAHGSYADLVADPDIDAIYIATPHPQHTDIALAAIAAGKPILVEKAFSATVADTERIVEAARAAGVFAMEAMWTRFTPGVVRARELIAEGAIGELRGVQGDLTAFRAFDAADRLFDPALGGGAVLDLGVYVLSFAQHFLGAPDVVHAVGGTFPTGVEGEFGVLLGYHDGRSATLSGGFTAYGPGRMMLLGTTGWIDVHPRFHRAPALTVWRGKTPEELTFPGGYQHEVIHVGECLAAGLTESPVMPLDDTLAVQRLMAEVLDQVRAFAGG